MKTFFQGATLSFRCWFQVATFHPFVTFQSNLRSVVARYCWVSLVTPRLPAFFDGFVSSFCPWRNTLCSSCSGVSLNSLQKTLSACTAINSFSTPFRPLVFSKGEGGTAVAEHVTRQSGDRAVSVKVCCEKGASVQPLLTYLHKGPTSLGR